MQKIYWLTIIFLFIVYPAFATTPIIQSEGGIISVSEVPTSHIPDGLTGTDINAFYNLIKSAKPPEKSPYETDTEYKKRLDETKTTFGNFNSGNIFVFKPEARYNQAETMFWNYEFSPKEDDGLGGVTYNADEKRFEAYIPPYVLLSWNSTPKPSYVASNALGVTMTVLKKDIKAGLLAITGQGQKECFANVYIPCSTLLLPVPSDQAKSLHPKLRVFYFVRIIPPYHEKRSDGGLSPEISYPYDTDVHENRIHAQLIDAVIYRTDTGEILTRWIRY